MMLETEGFEGNVGVNTNRVVTGGTGLFLVLQEKYFRKSSA